MKVSIILPVYNAEKFLKLAIESLLAQSFVDFEIIAINDGSKDSSVQILESFSDKRLRVVHNDINKGLIFSLNLGLSLAQGDFIARMDADDICHPERLARQLAFFLEHPEIDVVSTDMVVIDESGRPLFRPFLPVTDPVLMQWMLLRRNMLYHPTVMIKKERFIPHEIFYDPEALFAEDYELWLRLSRTKKLVNQNEILLFYRRHGASVTQSKLDNQLQNSYKIVQKHVEITYGVSVALDTLQIMNRPTTLKSNMDLLKICMDLKQLKSKFPFLELIEINFQGLLWQLLLVAGLRGFKAKGEILKLIDLKYFFPVCINGVSYLIRRSGIKEKINFFMKN